MKGVDLRQIIHKHYFGTDITEMKVDDKGQVAYQGKRGLEFLKNSSDSERDKEVNLTCDNDFNLQFGVTESSSLKRNA